MDCPKSTELASLAWDAADRAQHYGPVWERWADFAELEMTEPDTPVSSAVHARFDARMNLLGRKLRTIELGSDTDPASTSEQVMGLTCPDVLLALSLIERDHPCDALSFAWGCPSTSARAIDADLAAAHEESAQDWVDALEEACPSFRSSLAITLDCDSVPCILAYSLPDNETLGFNHLCNMAEADIWRHFRLGEDAPQIGMIPIWDEALRANPSIAARWEVERVKRQWGIVEQMTEALQMDER